MSARLTVERWFLALCVFPLFASASVYFEAVLASLSVGHWVRPSIDDPMSLQTAPVHVLTAVLLLALYPLLVFTSLVVLKNWRTIRVVSRYWFWVAVLLCGHLAVTVLPRRDPGQVWYWWWD